MRDRILILDVRSETVLRERLTAHRSLSTMVLLDTRLPPLLDLYGDEDIMLRPSFLGRKLRDVRFRPLIRG